MGLLNLFGKKLLGSVNEQAAWLKVALYYNGDAGFLIAPNGVDKKYGTVISEPVAKLNSDVPKEALGESVLSSFAAAGRRVKYVSDLIGKASGIKNWNKFSKMYRYVEVSKNLHGYTIQEWFREPKYSSYQPGDDKNEVHLPLGVTALDLGQAIMTCLAEKREKPVEDSLAFQLFDGRIMRFNMPPDDYVNVGDAHTDGYQVFEYAEKNSVYFGFIHGTDYDPLDSATIKETWERYYGKLLTFEFSQIAEGPFSYVAKAEGKGRIIRAFFFTDDGFWKEFLLHLDISGLTEKQVKSILADYEATAKSCVLSDLPF